MWDVWTATAAIATDPRNKECSRSVIQDRVVRFRHYYHTVQETWSQKTKITLGSLFESVQEVMHDVRVADVPPVSDTQEGGTSGPHMDGALTVTHPSRQVVKVVVEEPDTGQGETGVKQGGQGVNERGPDDQIRQGQSRKRQSQAEPSNDELDQSYQSVPSRPRVSSESDMEINRTTFNQAPMSSRTMGDTAEDAPRAVATTDPPTHDCPHVAASEECAQDVKRRRLAVQGQKRVVDSRKQNL